MRVPLLLLCLTPLLTCGGSSSSANTNTNNADGGRALVTDGSAPRPRSTEEPTVTREQIFRLQGAVLWDLAFLPDGSALFTVRSGELRRLVLGEGSSTLIADRMNPAFSGLFAESQSGLQGIAVDPGFAQNRRIYLYFSHNAGNTKDNRVVRYRLTEQLALADRADIVTGVSYKAVGTSNGGPGAHSGGRLRFGPDGFLYLTSGDNHSATIPQDKEALGGKVLRFDTDGKPAQGNPNIGSRNLIFALGFRNPQGIDFHPLTNEVFISEHGPNQDDEVTRISAGANGGWNPVGQNGEYNGYSGAKMTDTSAVPSAVKPVWIHNDSQGMSACAFLRGASWKGWEDRLAVGFLAGQKIVALGFDDGRASVTKTNDFPGVNERVRSLVMGPDERLYVTTDSGTIARYTSR